MKILSTFRLTEEDRTNLRKLAKAQKRSQAGVLSVLIQEAIAKAKTERTK